MASRKDRMAGRSSDDDEQPVDPLHRDNVPGELDNASGQADEFDAALVRGADGEPLDPEQLDVSQTHEVELAREAEAAYPAADRPSSGGEVAVTEKGVGRFAAFVRASWAELQRVQWPDRRQVGQATAVVLGFVVVAGLYLGLADYLAEQLVDLIL